MRRVSQQIGWSQESKLIYQLIKQTERLNQLLPGTQAAYNNTPVSRMIGWSNESNLYYEWLRSLDKLTQHYSNCCTTTTTTTTLGPTTRKVWGMCFTPMLRGGFQTNKVGWWVGNTYATVSATNPDFVYTGLKGGNETVPRGERWSRTVGNSEFGNFYTVSADYNFTDDLGVEIIKQLQDYYDFTKKVVANSFLASRNPDIRIYRCSYPQINIDGWWVVSVEFDATGAERDAYTFEYREYDIISFPTTLTFPFIYGTNLTSNGTATASNFPMVLDIPYADWVLGSTYINTVFKVEEQFPIPPLWG